MWHVIWHVIVGLALLIIGVCVAFLFFIMSVFASDKEVNPLTFAMLGIAALGAIAAIFGIWLLLFM